MNRFMGLMVIVRDVTGCSFEGTWKGPADHPGHVLVENCRQINVQDANVFPLTCEAWNVGDQVFNEHHIVGVHLTNLVPRIK